MKKCENCNKDEGLKGPNDYTLFDYCAICSKNLCPDCMKMGCCKNVPAKSGMKDDDNSDDYGRGPD